MSDLPWEKDYIKAAKAGDIESAIIGLVAAYDHVSFAEISRKFKPYLETEGDHAICSNLDPNIILFYGLSEGLADAILKVLSGGQVEIAPCSWLIYMIDGRLPAMPLAKRPPKAGYKNPCWVPVVLRLKKEHDDG